jgi:hypothetical protein
MNIRVTVDMNPPEFVRALSRLYATLSVVVTVGPIVKLAEK